MDQIEGFGLKQGRSHAIFVSVLLVFVAVYDAMVS